MSDPQIIHDQLEQLKLHRDNVRLYQRKILLQGGEALALPVDLHGLAEAQAGIARCKIELRRLGVVVPDQAADTSVPVMPPATSALSPHQRSALLDLLALRYRDRLAHNLVHTVRLQLGLHTSPDAVDPAWRRLHLRGPVVSQPIPPDTPLVDLFEAQGWQLLVLGAPGAGKTMLLVELAQALTARAQIDPAQRIPVVLNLASWRGQLLRDWLAEALRDMLGASRQFASTLARSEDLLLLLDGLDELPEERRDACIGAIEDYLGASELPPPLAVACRSQEYAALSRKLPVGNAVELEPLELPAIERALAGVPSAASALAALRSDPLLRELATTPLIVNVLLLTYGSQEPDGDRQHAEDAEPEPLSHEERLSLRRAGLWRAYIRRMFQQRPLERWPHAQALRWLRWLATVLRGQGATDFLLDDLQPTVLPTPRLLRRYQQLSIDIIATIIGSSMFAVFGLLIGIVLGLAFGPRSGLGMVEASVIGALLGVVGSVLTGPMIAIPVVRIISPLMTRLQSTTIYRKEVFEWQLSNAFEILKKHPKMILLMALLMAVVSGISAGFAFGFEFSLPVSMVSGVLMVIFVVLNSGWGVRRFDERIRPMQGITASLMYGLLQIFSAALLLSLAVSLATGFFVGIYAGLAFGIGSAFAAGLFGLFIGVVFSLGGSGAEAFLEHYALRHTLARAGLFPFRAVTFLDDMSARLLLERDGAVYRFRHLLLRDSIADLTDADIDRITHR